MTEGKILDEIAHSFIRSAGGNGYNGIVAARLLKITDDPKHLKGEIADLIQQDRISAVFSKTSVNIHIKRMPDLPKANQIELLDGEELSAICLYPSAAEVSERVDLTEWQDRPFSKALLLAEPQLAYRAFEMGALERYATDPRYHFEFDDYMGWMSVGDEHFRDDEHPERDKISLQTFGLGFDERRIPHIIVFLRYLSDLSPEHQQYWHSYLVSHEVLMCEPYYQCSIQGEWWENRSIRYAIAEELRLIRELTEAIWGQSLFRTSDDVGIPIGLNSFLRPTNENFNRFTMSLDKLLSESIDRSFFNGKCTLETETERSDGKVEVTRKGTLSLLQEWLLSEIVWDDPDDFVRVVIKPLRRIRKLRQTPAHSFTSDDFSLEYYEKRKQLLGEVLNSLSNIRLVLAKHPKASSVTISDWLDSDAIDVF